MLRKHHKFRQGHKVRNSDVSLVLLAQNNDHLNFRTNPHNREFKIRRLRTTATDKYATAHDQNHVTVHFSRVVLRLR